jgi:hypothetical protein
MMMRDSCQVLTRGPVSTDGYGNDSIGTVATTTVPCLFGGGSTTEVVQGSDQVTTNAECYLQLPDGLAVSALDQLVHAGVTYEIQGDPEIWASPISQVVSPTRVRLRKVTGAAAGRD